MASEFAHLTQADQHIAGAKERIVRQQQLIERLAAGGHSVRDAEGFLSALTGVLSAFESHRLLILKQLQPSAASVGGLATKKAPLSAGLKIKGESGSFFTLRLATIPSPGTSGDFFHSLRVGGTEPSAGCYHFC